MIGSAPGAMVCAISGTCLGIDAIPVAWQEKLGNRAYIKGLATGLAES
jgi:ADP-ribosylglycohydrolase